MINTRLEGLIHDFATRILPTVYDDSMTYLELVYKMKHYLNLTVDQVNALTEAFNLVLTETLPANIGTVLDGMIQDGSLASVINLEILKPITDKLTYVDVLQYGAAVTSASIQAAIDAIKGNIPANSWDLLSDGKFIIQLPKGVFTLTSPINVPSYIKIKGHGRASTILKLQGVNGFNFGVTGNEAFNFSLEGLTVDGVNKDTTGITVKGARFIMKDVTIINCNLGLLLYGGYLGELYSMFIQYCNTGVSFDGESNGLGSHAVHFFGGEIQHCYDKGVSARYGNSSGFYGTSIEDCGVGVFMEPGNVMNAFKLDNIYFEANPFDIKGDNAYGLQVESCFFGEAGKADSDVYVGINKLYRSSFRNNLFGRKLTAKEIAPYSTNPADVAFVGNTIAGNQNPTYNMDISDMFKAIMQSNGVYDNNDVTVGNAVLSGMSFRNKVTFYKEITQYDESAGVSYPVLSAKVNTLQYPNFGTIPANSVVEFNLDVSGALAGGSWIVTPESLPTGVICTALSGGVGKIKVLMANVTGTPLGVNTRATRMIQY